MYYDENPNEYNNSTGGNGDNVENNSSAGQDSYNNSDNQQNNYYDNYSNSNNGQNGYYNNENYYGGSQGGDNQDKKKNNKKIWGVVAIIVAIIFIVSTAATAISSISNRNEANGIEDLINGGEKETEESKYEDIGSTEVQDSTGSASTSSGIVVTDVSGVVDNTMPSIVAITSTTLMESSYDYYNDIFDYYFGGGGQNGNNDGQTYEEQAAGSGIIVDQTDTELLIVTNNHVVEGADSLEIQFNGQNEKDTIPGYIKGTDANVDVAVVAVKLEDIPNTVLENIKKATLGDSDALKVGEGVIAIGNALGFGQSVTTGIISAKDREASIDDKTMKLLQTDAAINGGNSGGALINAKGEVIGINVAKYSSSDSSSASIEGMGFAIPISSVKSIIDTLETKETKTKVSEEEKGYLGIVGYNVDESTADQYAMPEGVLVYEVTKGGPAEKAGIAKSDVITKLDDQAVTSMDNLSSMLDYYKAGEKVKVTIAYRDGREYTEKDVTVTLASKSDVEELQNK